MVALMKKMRLLNIFTFGVFLLLIGCTQVTQTALPAPATQVVIVSSLVANTLTALAPSTSSNPVSLPAASTTPKALDLVQVPSVTPAPTFKQTGTSSPTPSATPVQLVATPTAAVPLEPTAAPAAQTVQTSASVPTTSAGAASSVAACIDKAAFVDDVTIPDETLIPAATQFTKTWRIKNVGTCTWGAGYQLIFARGNILGGPPSSPLPGAAPGQMIDVSVKLEAPAQGGRYAGDWEFQNAAGKRFGVNSHGEDFIFVVIRADWGPGVGPTATPVPVNCAYEPRSDYESQLLQWINQARAANGAAPFTLQSQLTAAALLHSADMACNSYLDHSGSDKSTYSSRIRAQGYLAKSDRENIFGGGDAKTAFDWWMGSPIHRQNILDKSMTQIGIASVNYSKSTFGIYYTLTFGRP